MVRPFFKWMVSADASAKARVNPSERIMTRNRIQAHSSNRGKTTHVTKVLLVGRGLRFAAALWLAMSALPAAGQNPSHKPAEALYLQLGQVELDVTMIYQ